jgi:hypothetical protein
MKACFFLSLFGEHDGFVRVHARDVTRIRRSRRDGQVRPGTGEEGARGRASPSGNAQSEGYVAQRNGRFEGSTWPGARRWAW